MNPILSETTLPHRPAFPSNLNVPINPSGGEEPGPFAEGTPSVVLGSTQAPISAPLSAPLPIVANWRDGNFDPRSLEGDDNDDLLGNLRPPLLAFGDEAADTLIYIDPAPHHPEQTDSYPLTMRSTETAPHRIHSSSLSRTGSKVFEKMFEPRYQYRVRKRRGQTEKLPDGIKYVLDLTPEAEGDEALIYMTEVSCPMGIRTWGEQIEILGLPRVCVGGEDEREWHLPHSTAMHSKEVNDRPAELLKGTALMDHIAPPTEIAQPRPRAPRPRMNWDGVKPRPPIFTELSGEVMCVPETTTPAPVLKKVPGLPMDYSGVRHRACIERVLHALEGLDPRLDTAPKLWTFIAVAKLFEVGSDALICNPVLSWLFCTSNALFIELHPEITYRIAHAISHGDLCRITFSILVGEEASHLLRNQGQSGPVRETRTIYGRYRETLDDTELQRIEYASKAFMERILQSFVDFVGADMFWVDQIARKSVFSEIAPVESPFFLKLIRTLKETIRAFIFRVLDLSMRTRPVNGSHNFSPNTDIIPSADFLAAYSSMGMVERVLCRTFWFRLRAMSLLDELEIVNGGSMPSFLLSNLAPHVNAFARQGEVPIVSHGLLELQARVLELYPRFNLNGFLDEVQSHIRSFCDGMTRTPAVEVSNYGIWFDHTDVLLCLDDHEYQFLPLWANGNDDGTGGVFVDQALPILETGGFSKPGPGIHTGRSIARSEVHSLDDSSMDSFSTIYPSDAASTTQRASHVADSGCTTTIPNSGSSDQLWHEIRDFDLQSAEGSTTNSHSVEDNSGLNVLKRGMSTAVDMGDTEVIEFEFDSDNGEDDIATIGADSISDIEMVNYDDGDNGNDDDNDDDDWNNKDDF